MSDPDTDAATRSHHGIDLMEQPAIGLLYLLFVFLPMAFVPQLQFSGVAFSLLACLAFLPLYRGRLGRRSLPAALRWLGAAAIGALLIPFNPGGNTFLIYAAGLAGHLLPPRQALAAGLALALATAGLFLFHHGLKPWATGFVLITLVIGAMVLGGSVYGQLQARRLADLKPSQDEVRRLAQLAERERIARDLHDLLGHTLSLVVLKSELAGKLLPRDPEAARVQIAEVEQVARKALGEVRDAVSGYRRGDLEAELAASRLALLSAGIELQARLSAPARRAEVDHALALCLREACTNVLRHARATRVQVELVAAHGELSLSVADDGRGGAIEEGNGLLGIRERLAALGGELQVESVRGAGTRLRMRVPAGWAAPA